MFKVIEILTLSKTTSLFLSSKTLERYRQSSALASPSDGGAAIATLTASAVKSGMKTVRNLFLRSSFSSSKDILKEFAFAWQTVGFQLIIAGYRNGQLN